MESAWEVTCEQRGMVAFRAGRSCEVRGHVVGLERKGHQPPSSHNLNFSVPCAS